MKPCIALLRMRVYFSEQRAARHLFGFLSRKIDLMDKRVLIVDDSPLTRGLVREFIEWSVRHQKFAEKRGDDGLEGEWKKVWS